MNKKTRCIITITDNISSTNMPFNEFVLYRHKHMKDEENIIIVFGKDENSAPVPEGITVLFVGRQIKSIRLTVNNVVEMCNKKGLDYLFHIHEGKSVTRFAIATCGKYKEKIVYTVHSTFSGYKLHSKIFCMLAALNSNKTICVSKTAYKYFPKFLKGILGKRVFYIQNGVDVERIDRTTSLVPNEKHDGFQLIYVARFVEVKDHKRLIDLINKIPDVRLVLIGIGPLKDFIKRLCKDKGLENRVIFTDLLSREDVFKNLLQSDMFISTSRLEGLPIAVMEAACMNLPMVLSDIEQHREVAEDCKYIDIAKDDENFIETIDKYINMPCEERERIGRIIKKHVSNKFSLDAMHVNYNKAYEEILSKK